MRVSNRFRPRVEQLEARDLPSTYYVANGGNDTHAGTSAAPWATIQHAADTMVAGDTVAIEAGTYAGFDVQTSGTASAPITYEAAPGALVIINSPEANRGDSGINIEDWNNGAAMDYITIQGLDINNATGNIKNGIRLVWNGKINSTGIQLLDNTITNCAAFGILTSHEDNLLIEGNSVSGTTGTGTIGHGIYVSNACFSPHVIGNTIFNNQSLGLHMNGDESEGAAIEPDGTDDGNAGNIIGAVVEDNVIYDNGINGINCDGVQNSFFENNLLYDNGGGIVLYVIDAAAPAINNEVANNTITVLSTDDFGNTGRWDIQVMDGTPDAGALPDAGSTGNVVFNNILINQNPNHGSIEVGPLSLAGGLYSNYNVITTSGDTGSSSSHAFDLVDSSGNDHFVSLTTWQSNTGQDKNSITADSAQLFVSPSWSSPGGNYQLLATSPAIDAGAASLQGKSAPSVDILGNPRPSGAGYDIGAYEFQVSSSFSDNFNRTGPGLGSSWQLPPSFISGFYPFQYRRHVSAPPVGFQLSNNQAVSTDSSWQVAADQVVGLSLLNPTVQADVTVSGNQAVGLLARAQSNGDAYVARLTATANGTAQIWLYHGATDTFSLLKSQTGVGTTGTLKFTITGATPTLTLFMGGVQAVQVTGNTAITTAGDVGIIAWGPNGIIDNFSAS
jgi:hypothetical protein